MKNVKLSKLNKKGNKLLEINGIKLLMFYISLDKCLRLKVHKMCECQMQVKGDPCDPVIRSWL